MTNAELAQHIRDLRDFLIIAGYDPTHAVRYTSIAREIERTQEPVENMMRQGRLRDIPGIGPVIARYIREIIVEGKSSKQTDWEHEVPYSVVTMLRVPGLGVRTVEYLFRVRDIKSLDELKEAVRLGHLDHDDMINEKLREAIRTYGA